MVGLHKVILLFILCIITVCFLLLGLLKIHGGLFYYDSLYCHGCLASYGSLMNIDFISLLWFAVVLWY